MCVWSIFVDIQCLHGDIVSHLHLELDGLASWLPPERLDSRRAATPPGISMGAGESELRF